MYLYQKTKRYFAQVANDIRDLAQEELLSLGATEVHQAYRGLHFTADPGSLYELRVRALDETKGEVPPCPQENKPQFHPTDLTYSTQG